MSDRFKFRTPHFKIKGGAFSHFSYWGRTGPNEFTGPQSDNFTEKGDDEQCLGLRDEAGTLIYEGDVVEVPVDGESYIGVVEWIDGEKLELDVTGWYKLCIADNELSPVFGSEELIIGNIHENPELLEAK